MAASIEAPIFVIGTHRSGTTLLGRALGHHPEVAYWEEPRQVWSWGHNYRPDDALSRADASARVKAHIRRSFRRYLDRRGRPRLAEKTPSNCLRLEFIHEIFPDGRFIHIYRDGRAVISSTDLVRRTRTPETEFYAKRLLGTPLWEWPAFVPRAWRTLGRRLFSAEMAYWGPQPPGWREWLRRDDRLTVLAKQWRYTLEPVLAARESIPAEQWLDLRYEDLVTSPARHGREIERFAGLSVSREFVEHLVGECRSDRIDAWRERLEGAPLEELRPVLEPLLERLGYTW